MIDKDNPATMTPPPRTTRETILVQEIVGAEAEIEALAKRSRDLIVRVETMTSALVDSVVISILSDAEEPVGTRQLLALARKVVGDSVKITVERLVATLVRCEWMGAIEETPPRQVFDLEKKWMKR